MARFLAALFLIVFAFGKEPRRGGSQSPRETVGETSQDPLVHFHLGELRLQQRNFQSAANEFREALKVQPRPDWIDAWAHFHLGEIFDVTGQRDRAIREYRLAAQTGDDIKNLKVLVAERLNKAATADDLHREEILVEYLSVPRVLTRVAPAYSPEARIAELEGTVMLAATIAANGSMKNSRVVSSLGLGLDEEAQTAAAQWSFEPARTKDGPAPMEATAELTFLFPAKRSRWHLVGVKFDNPEGSSRPHFLSALYPKGTGIGAETADEAHLVAAMRRQELVRLSFGIDTAGRPVRFSFPPTDASWAREAIAFVSAWRFAPASKGGLLVSSPCSIKLVWGERPFVQSSLQWATEAMQSDATRSSPR